MKKGRFSVRRNAPFSTLLGSLFVFLTVAHERNGKADCRENCVIAGNEEQRRIGANGEIAEQPAAERSNESKEQRAEYVRAFLKKGARKTFTQMWFCTSRDIGRIKPLSPQRDIVRGGARRNPSFCLLFPEGGGVRGSADSLGIFQEIKNQ